MKTFRLLSIPLLLVFLLLLPADSLAATYLFSVDEMTMHVYWNEDGTTAIDYVFVFTNDSSASPIDYVDVGLPNSNFVDSTISADVNGVPVYDISRSGFQGNGVGVAVGLGSLAIPPGQTGRVHVFVGQVQEMIYPDSQDKNYVSAAFSNPWFGAAYVLGSSRITVTYHFPPGMGPDEPRWHAAPPGFPSEPATGIDEQGRVFYTWRNDQASASKQYDFGASFPKQYVPESVVVRPSLLQMLGVDPGALFNMLICGGCLSLFLIGPALSLFTTRKRRLQYLPPKIAIEGHGIKRGLTAVEAAILLEQPLDKILTMILFSVIKKNAAQVTQPDPLTLDMVDPLPQGLQPYEVDFLKAFRDENKARRRNLLQTLMVDLIKEVANKMKGFSRNETIAYYRDITQRAWSQVEAAQTPEVKSEKFEEVMDWTMLDRDYDDRTREVFRTGPVFVPTWWGRYDPDFRRSVSGPSTSPVSMPSPASGGGQVSLPTLPGANFAAGLVRGVQNFSAGVVGNVTEFTSGVTNKTNPVPVTRTSTGGSRSSGGGGCACACACAGCACACAGGGR